MGEAKRPQSPSPTVPGQSLKPAEVIERHLAGTLPDIQKTPQYTHDEDGNQISEDLSKLELHELFDLGARLKREYDERFKEQSDAEAERLKKQHIDEYLAQQSKDNGQEGKPL